MPFQLKLFIYWLIMVIVSRLFFEVCYCFDGEWDKQYCLDNKMYAVPHGLIFWLGIFYWATYLIIIFTEWFFNMQVFPL